MGALHIFVVGGSDEMCILTDFSTLEYRMILITTFALQ